LPLIVIFPAQYRSANHFLSTTFSTFLDITYILSRYRTVDFERILDLEMRFQPSVLAILSVSALSQSSLAFSSSMRTGRNAQSSVYSTIAESAPTSPAEDLTNAIISKLHFREAQRELERLHLDTGGTLSAMRKRLRNAALHNYAEDVNGDGKVRVIEEEKMNQVCHANSTLTAAPT
jgi:hypothetical protein